MHPLARSRLAAAALLCAGVAGAQTAVAPANPTTPNAATDAQVQIAAPGADTPVVRLPLTPFRASYLVLRNGSATGTAFMQVVQIQGNRWRIDLGIRGTQGLAGLAGMNIQQSTVFERDGEALRPISQSTVQNLLLNNKTTTGTFDWAHATAQWTGDMKKTRAAPVPLQTGDLTALLTILAIMRDARPGNTMQFRVVDNGRARAQTFTTLPAQETLKVGDLSYQAWHVKRTAGAMDAMEAWIADNVPSPVRILQDAGAAGQLDLQLTDYKGMQK